MPTCNNSLGCGCAGYKCMGRRECPQVCPGSALGSDMPSRATHQRHELVATRCWAKRSGTADPSLHPGGGWDTNKVRLGYVCHMMWRLCWWGAMGMPSRCGRVRDIFARALAHVVSAGVAKWLVESTPFHVRSTYVYLVLLGHKKCSCRPTSPSPAEYLHGSVCFLERENSLCRA